MRRNALWILGALALVALPAVLGVVLLGGDGNSQQSRRAAALGSVAPDTGNNTLVIAPITSTTVGIIVESYSWGVSVPYATGTTGGTTGKPALEPLTITKGLDSTSAALFLNAAQGKHIPSAILRLNGGNGGMYELTDVVISTVQHGGGKEQVSLNYARIKFTGPTTSEKAGAGAVPSATWDLATAKGS